MPGPHASLPIGHVSETAFLVARCRAAESARRAPRFRDPFAACLAGPHARALSRRIPFLADAQWAVAVRTWLIDERIRALVAMGVDTVIDLAAGLDARAYRLSLPRSLRWIEVDFPDIVDYKTRTLCSASPACQLQRVAIDLTDDAARRALLSRFGRDARQALVITEGLLPYLTPATVDALAADLERQTSIGWWLMDVTTPEALVSMIGPRNAGHPASRVELPFAPAGGAAYFRRFGWTVKVFESFAEGGARCGRRPPKRLTPRTAAGRTLRRCGVALLERAQP